MQSKVCPPLVTSVPCTSVSWQPGTRRRSAEGQVCSMLMLMVLYLSFPSLCQRRGGGGAGSPHTLFPVFKKGSQSKLQVGTHGPGAGRPRLWKGRWALLPSNQQRNLYPPLLTSPPCHLVTATCSWASGSRVGHNSPHARRVSQASPPPLAGGLLKYIVLPACGCPGVAPRLRGAGVA